MAKDTLNVREDPISTERQAHSVILCVVNQRIIQNAYNLDWICVRPRVDPEWIQPFSLVVQ